MRPIALAMSLLVGLLLVNGAALADEADCEMGLVWEDSNGNGRQDPGERPLPGIRLWDGERLLSTDAHGRFAYPGGRDGSLSIIKPAGHALPMRADGLPDAWVDLRSTSATPHGHGNSAAASAACRDFALLPRPAARDQPLEVLLFGDPQVKSMRDVDFFKRDIVEPLLGLHGAQLGITLGDLVDDRLELLPEVVRSTSSLGIPWMNVPGNHDIDLDAANDAEALRSFRQHAGPDTYAREEANAVFIALDNVIHLPGQRPAYVGGLRADQFDFLEAYLPTLGADRLLVLAMHIPLFNTAAGDGDSFRPDDRQRLFALLARFPHVLVLSAHTHVQRQVRHDLAAGWTGAQPLHEYNVGAACGAFWSGVEDADGIPDATMADGTPNGHARLQVHPGGRYALAWHPARDPAQTTIGLHLPKVLRQGAYPAWGVYANVYMGEDDTLVEYRVGEGPWQAMRKVLQPDPALLVENARDDQAEALRGYDRSPEAKPSHHLWRGSLPTDLAPGLHRVEVRAQDRWQGEQRATTRYRLETAEP